jgi:hypothetical protein
MSHDSLQQDYTSPLLINNPNNARPLYKPTSPTTKQEAPDATKNLTTGFFPDNTLAKGARTIAHGKGATASHATHTAGKGSRTSFWRSFSQQLEPLGLVLLLCDVSGCDFVAQLPQRRKRVHVQQVAHAFGGLLVLGFLLPRELKHHGLCYVDHTRLLEPVLRHGCVFTVSGAAPSASVGEQV